MRVGLVVRMKIPLLARGRRMIESQNLVYIDALPAGHFPYAHFAFLNYQFWLLSETINDAHFHY